MMTIAPKRPSVRLVFLALILAELTAGFETTMVYAALKTLIETFNDPVGAGWLITIYLLVSAAAAAICGRLGDIYGRRRMVLIVLAMAVTGSAISAFSDSLTGVIMGRGIQGMAGAIMPLCFGLARENLPEEKVGIGIGVITATGSVGSTAGLILGGLLLDNFAWNSMFLVSAGMAAISLMGVWLCLPPSPQRKSTEPLDLLGGMLFVPAIVGVLIAISNGASWGWLDMRTLLCGLGGVAIGAYWVIYELRHKTPLINVRLLATRQAVLANAVIALIALGTMNVLPVLSLLVQQPTWTMVGLGASATVAGLLKVPSNVFGIAAATWCGWIAGKRGGRFPMVIGIGACTAGWLLLIPFHHSVWHIMLALILISGGLSTVITAVPSIIVAIAPADRTSEATGLTSVIRALAQSVGSQLLIFLLAAETISGDPAIGPGVFPTRESYVRIFALIGGTNVLAMLVALALPKAPQPQLRAAPSH